MLDIPSWGGRAQTLVGYKRNIGNTRLAMNPKDYHTTVSRLTPRLTGIAKDTVYRTHVEVAPYSTPDGVYGFIRWLSQTIGIDHSDEENKFSRHTFQSLTDKGTKVRDHGRRKSPWP